RLPAQRPLHLHARAADARRESGRRVPVRYQGRVLRALLVLLHAADARRRHSRARGDRLSGRGTEPGRPDHDRAPVRRARLDRSVSRRPRLGAHRPDGGVDATAPERRPGGGAAADADAAAFPASRVRMAEDAPPPVGGGSAQVERLGARLRPGAPARADAVLRHARCRLAEADRVALKLPRPDDRGAPRLVAEAPRPARPGAESLAALLRQARRPWRGARGARGPARLRGARGARTAGGAPADPAHRRALHRRALRPEKQRARGRAPAAPGARAAPRVRATFAAWFLLAAGAAAAAATPLAERPEVRAFIGELVERHGFAEAELKQMFSRVERVEPVLQSIAPAERPPWEEYRAQFVPRSVRRYGVDFDGDGAVDLRRSSADAVGSVANFLKSHGWQPGEPVAFRASVPPGLAAVLADGSVQPRLRLGDLLNAGVSL